MTIATLRRPLVAGLSATFALRICAIGLTFVQTLALTRVFGAEIYGVLSLAISLGALGMLGLSLGMDQVMMRDLARVGPSKAKTSAIWQNTVGQTRRFVVPLTIAVTTAASFVAMQSASEQAPAFLAIALCLPLLLMRKFLENWLLGAGKVLRSMLASQIVFPVVITLGAAVLLVSPITADLRAASTLYVLAALLSVVAALILSAETIRRTWPDTLRYENPAALGTGRALGLVSFGFLASQNIDVILTGFLSDPKDVALVRVSGRAAEVLGLMRMVAVLHYKPKIAAAFGQGDLARVQRQAQTLTLIFVASGVPLFLVLWIWAEPILSLFGPEFPAAASVLRLYLIGIGLTLLAGPCTLLLTLCDGEKVAARILWSALAVNALLDLILIPAYGALGCAIANVAALATLSGLGVWATRQRTGIDPSCLSLFRKEPPCLPS